MKPSTHMQQIITALAAKHAFDLAVPDVSLRLDMPNFDRLVIECVGPRRISVAHYFEQHGDLVADPEVVFFVPPGGWYPIEITQVFGGYRQVAWLTSDGSDIDRYLPVMQREIASFGNLWGRNIRAQGWLEHGVRR